MCDLVSTPYIPSFLNTWYIMERSRDRGISCAPNCDQPDGTAISVQLGQRPILKQQTIRGRGDGGGGRGTEDILLSFGFQLKNVSYILSYHGLPLVTLHPPSPSLEQYRDQWRVQCVSEVAEDLHAKLSKVRDWMISSYWTRSRHL
ncbi:hypothetical protein CEXT_466871 [Caerostris extrusa]|uniref:Uncharacterized protein n=1 Tax=Caerostris extrusa TaxID=172846 RepID=A0AAV4MC18_CAEEX|nr:hypothetical protein CEXT_466871 [Caerostris extrusa]